jgi:anti-sigma B factor antagonist
VDQLTVSVRAGDSYLLVTLAGESDANTGQLLRDVLVPEASKGLHRLIIDLSGLCFIDSAGVHVLTDVRAILHDHGGELILAAPQPVVARVLTLVGADQLIPVYADLDAALAAAVPDAP